MYTSYIGKKFLKIYNESKSTSLSAREFFDGVMFPIFFDSDQHLMHVSNSPFFQKPTQQAIERAKSKSMAQLEKLHEDISKDSPNMAIYVGYAAKDVQGTTSGQLTSMQIEIDSEEMYSSWIGEALGIGVSGGFVVLIDNKDVLQTLYSGWQMYRKFLSQTPNLKDKQIETWNGHWLAYTYSQHRKHQDDNEDLFIETSEVQGNIAIPTNSWVKLIFALTYKFPNQELICNAYNLSQTNTTLGFIKLYLPEIKRFYDLRDKIFIDKSQTILSDRQIEQLEPFYNFRNACMNGTIGLKSIEPKGLRAYMPKGTYQYTQGKDFKFSDENNFYNFLIYKLWIIAMLNKTELLDLASQVVVSILEYEKQSKPDSRGKTALEQETKSLFESKSIKAFVDNLTEAMPTQPQNGSIFRKVIQEVLSMPVDNFPLFLSLIKFEYNFQKHSSEK